MAYVVTENCQRCRYTECASVCPAECFYELDDMLVIDPEECVDCDRCVPVCPVQAIYSDEDVPENLTDWIETNRKKTEELKNEGKEPIVTTIEAFPGAEDRRKELGF